ncbi:5-formyltetrahydrofolate cyclo-ligase [Chryseobacterium shandongense]|uniref:5-formyltetrahydrofolate cyclo-ligase n=1 Tax=Chryseobacterium shandongense TaxID=1493872 RepID=A0AAD1DL76_9FLAO|nr:5-formyltetrahydrofolate cyclo-ligase [Chryseobacterium shandongense]AZA87122.1 5-formyltetrahydrofolate cyclo-ligase [Chryseobacterium shandongense]AZA95551.1 5-formyltetrahydrofolate cyclo-ligase [Chryseobacterium shandongense]
MKKSYLRKKYLEKRESLSDEEIFQHSENIFRNFIEYFKPLAQQKVHIFIPIHKFKEVNTGLFTDYFFSRNIKVFVPKIVDTKLIAVEIFADSKFELNNWGISEPVSNEDSGVLDFDYIITPLLYCDKFGNRIGYGKGFYDGFFESVSKESKKIGVNYFNPDENIDDVWEGDIPLDYLVTPRDVLSFFNKGLE